jgi:hypothetical protein
MALALWLMMFVVALNGWWTPSSSTWLGLDGKRSIETRAMAGSGSARIPIVNGTEAGRPN